MIKTIITIIITVVIIYRSNNSNNTPFLPSSLPPQLSPLLIPLPPSLRNPLPPLPSLTLSLPSADDDRHSRRYLPLLRHAIQPYGLVFWQGSGAIGVLFNGTIHADWLFRQYESYEVRLWYYCVHDINIPLLYIVLFYLNSPISIIRGVFMTEIFLAYLFMYMYRYTLWMMVNHLYCFVLP